MYQNLIHKRMQQINMQMSHQQIERVVPAFRPGAVTVLLPLVASTVQADNRAVV